MPPFQRAKEFSAMTQYQADEKAKFRRQRTEQAIQLAMQNKWEEAITVNKSIIEVIPNDVDAFNRLGKALMEVGRFAEARSAYGSAVENDPSNTIARKNLARLKEIKETEGEAAAVENRISPRIFIEETGKTGHTSLLSLAGREILAKLTAGDALQLQIEDKNLVVLSSRSERIGVIEPRLALRLISLIQGGNQYVAAVTSLSETSVDIIIRESYQHPSQAGKLSFPSRAGADGFRSYIRDSVLRRDHDEEDEINDDAEYGGDWEEEPESSNQDEVSLDFEEDHSDKDDEFDSD